MLTLESLYLPVSTRHTHTHPFNGPFPGLPRSAGTRKAKPIWILLKQETVSGSGISWAVCKSAPHSKQITTPTPHHSVFYRPDALPAAQPTASKHCSFHTPVHCYTETLVHYYKRQHPFNGPLKKQWRHYYTTLHYITTTYCRLTKKKLQV